MLFSLIRLRMQPNKFTSIVLLAQNIKFELREVHEFILDILFNCHFWV